MKTILIFLALFSTSAFSAEDRWTTHDTYREAAFQVLNIIDWGQTRYVAKHPDKYHEVTSAWVIGQNPSTTDVDRMMIFNTIVHPIVSYYLPRNWRDAFQYITIGTKLEATIGNASIGIKIEF